MLNPDSPLPLYHQLADLLMEQIDAGDYQSGDMLPSEISMAQKYGIGRPTVRQAMSVLLEKHLIERKRGAGTFVKKRTPQIDLFSLAGTSKAFSTQGIETESKIITPITTLKRIDDGENPFNGEIAYFLSRLTLLKLPKKEDERNELAKEKEPVAVAGPPILLEEIYLHHGLFSGLEKIDLKNRSLAQVISDQFYMKPTIGHQCFTLETLSPERAALLDLSPNAPILEVMRTLDFPNAAAGLFSRLYCRTDRFSFSQTIPLDG